MQVTADLEQSLQQEIIVALNQDVVVAVPLFHFCKVKTQQDICYRLRPGTIKSALYADLCATCTWVMWHIYMGTEF